MIPASRKLIISVSYLSVMWRLWFRLWDEMSNTPYLLWFYWWCWDWRLDVKIITSNSVSKTSPLRLKGTEGHLLMSIIKCDLITIQSPADNGSEVDKEQTWPSEKRLNIIIILSSYSWQHWEKMPQLFRIDSSFPQYWPILIWTWTRREYLKHSYLLYTKEAKRKTLRYFE